MSLHPWHDIAVGKDAPEVVTGIIEIPANSRAKYELDKDTGMLIFDRLLYSSMSYPANYGFIPQTYCDDKDPLDVLVISKVDIVPMCLVNAKVIGVMKMIDGDEQDDKIIAVAADDITVSHYDDISELPPHTLKEIKAFFEEYKNLENKSVTIEAMLGKKEAIEIVKKSIVDYKEKFGEKELA